MADSLTIVYDGLRASETGVDPTNSATATGVGAKEALIGPPRDRSQGNLQGRFIRQTSGSSGTFRWIADERLDKTVAVPTTFLYTGLTT